MIPAALVTVLVAAYAAVTGAVYHKVRPLFGKPDLWDGGSEDNIPAALVSTCWPLTTPPLLFWALARSVARALDYRAAKLARLPAATARYLDEPE